MTASASPLRRWSFATSSSHASPRLAAALRHAARRGLAGLRPLLPQACALCRRPSGSALLCAPCEAALPALGPACPRCALPGRDDAPCARCLRRPPPWSRATAAWTYAFPVDRLVQQLKYGGRLALAEPLAAGLARAVQAGARAPVDALVPLPLARARQRRRGFNQSQLLAGVLARHLGRPVVQGLVRVRDDGPQAAAGQPRRAAQMHGAFVARPALQGLHVAIVDDVMTTGATLGAAARAALEAGARRVDVHVVARTLPP